MNDTVKSATRVLDLLELFSTVTEALGVSDVAKRLELPKSSAQALLLTLQSRGYLVRQGEGYLLPSELRGGWVGGSCSRLLALAAPVMKRMAQESGESAFVGVMTGSGKVRYMAKEVSPKEVRYDASLAHLRPAYCTSIGLVILAHSAESQVARCLRPGQLLPVTSHTETDPGKIQALLRQARTDGYVEVRDANVEGASGVSAPIFDSRGEVIAGLNLGAPTSRYERTRADLIRIVCREAALLTASLRSPAAAAAAGQANDSQPPTKETA